MNIFSESKSGWPTAKMFRAGFTIWLFLNVLHLLQREKYFVLSLQRAYSTAVNYRLNMEAHRLNIDSTSTQTPANINSTFRHTCSKTRDMCSIGHQHGEKHSCIHFCIHLHAYVSCLHVILVSVRAVCTFSRFLYALAYVFCMHLNSCTQ